MARKKQDPIERFDGRARFLDRREQQRSENEALNSLVGTALELLGDPEDTGEMTFSEDELREIMPALSVTVGHLQREERSFEEVFEQAVRFGVFVPVDERQGRYRIDEQQHQALKDSV